MSARIVSNVAIVLVVLLATATTVVGAVSTPRTFPTFGLNLAWETEANGTRTVRVLSVAPDSSAARAGIVAGDRIVAFGSLADRITLMAESNNHTGYYLAPGQPANFTIAHGNSVVEERLRAGDIPSTRPIWLMLLRAGLYTLGALFAAGLVLWRPEPITWGFAIFVILGQQPNVPYLELAARHLSPLGSLMVFFFVVPCLSAIGALGLPFFAVRFPERAPSSGYRRIERALQIFEALVVVAFVEFYLGQLYGAPTFGRAQLVYAITFVPPLVAIGLLARTLFLSRGENRVRLQWAIVGPSLGTLLTLADIAALAIGLPYFYGVSFGLLASITPFSMAYAILRHRVIDIGLVLNQTVAEAVALTEPATGAQLDRRDLVRRVALLLSTDLPLNGLYAQLVTLLARFVDASSVLVVRGNAQRAQLEYNFEKGVGARPDAMEIPPDSVVGSVLRSGNPVLLRAAREWPAVRRVSVAGRPTIAPESAIFVPVKFAGTMLGVISVQSERPDAYQEADVRILETCALYLGARIHDEEGAATGARGPAPAVGYCTLTGLPGRSAFDDALTRTWESVSPVAVLLLDVDLFSAFNATYGHVAADVCLREVAASIVAAVDVPGGSVSRYAAETFAVVLPGCDADNAARVGERIREAVRASAIAYEGSSLGLLTVSIGFASMVTGVYDDPQSIVTLANLQLRAAKQRGCNRVFGEGYESDSPPALRCGIANVTLPVPDGEFVGCERTLAEIERLLHEHSLVTLTGPDGSGKTRLALEVAKRNVSAYPDGVWFIDLSNLNEPALLAQTLTATLFPGLDVEADDARLVELLREHTLLLILDDCTHLIKHCARLAEALLGGSNGVRILATAQASIGIGQEAAFEVRGLDGDDALALLHARLRVRVSEAEAARVAGALGGFPEAIEVAAAFWNPAQITQGETLASLLERTYHALPPSEQTVMRRLAVMSNGWMLARAAAVCADEAVSIEQAGQLLQDLAARALISGAELGGHPHYRLSRAMRAIAERELLAAGEATRAALAHVKYFAGYASDVAKRKGAVSFQRWSELQISAFPNYRSALRHALSDPSLYAFAADILRGLRGMLLPLAASCDFASRLRENLQRTDLTDAVEATFWLALAELEALHAPLDSLRAARRALDLYEGRGDAQEMAYAACSLARAQLDARGAIEERMEPVLAAALQAAQGATDARLTVGLLRSLASLYSDRGRHDEAQRYLREAALKADPTDTASLAELLGTSALEEFRLGNLDGALAMWRQAAALDEEHRPIYAALCFVSIGRGELARGDLVAARVALRNGLAALKAAGHAFGIAYSFDYFTRLAKQGGDNYRAARIAGFTASLYERGPVRPSTEEPQFYLLLDELRQALGQRAFNDEWNRGHFMSLEEAVLEAKAA